jgi:hypothetical protein
MCIDPLRHEVICVNTSVAPPPDNGVDEADRETSDGFTEQCHHQADTGREGIPLRIPRKKCRPNKKRHQQVNNRKQSISEAEEKSSDGTKCFIHGRAIYCDF